MMTAIGRAELFTFASVIFARRGGRLVPAGAREPVGAGGMCAPGVSDPAAAGVLVDARQLHGTSFTAAEPAKS